MNESQEHIKTPFYKRWWFIGLVILLIIGIFSSGGEDTDKNQNNVVEQEKVEAVSTDTDRTAAQQAFTAAKDVLSEESKVRLTMDILKKSYDGIAEISYDEENKAFMFDLIGDSKTAINWLLLFPDNPDLVSAWDKLVEGFKAMSSSMAENMGTGFKFCITNPNNTDNVLLIVVDGKVAYDFMDEYR